MHRRSFLITAGAALGSMTTPMVRATSAYPSRVVKIVVPYPAGSGPDMLGRVVAQRLQDVLGQSVMVENRAGALGIVGTMEVARANADGHTLLVATNTTHAANVALHKKLAYDPVKDFTAVTRLTTGPMMLLVGADSPYKSATELIEQGKTGKSFSVGYGSAASQVSAAKFALGAGLNVITVAYKGIPAAVTDMLGGHIDFTFADLPVAFPLIQSGRVRALGVTSDKRLQQEPTIPILQEFVPDLQIMGWQGIVAPAGLPPEVTAKLANAFHQAFESELFVAKLKEMHQTVAPLYGNDFENFIITEIERWKRDAKLAGIEPQ